MGKSALSVLVLFFVSFAFISCQEDNYAEEAGGLNNSSELTVLLASMAANNTNIDNIIDNTGCFSIVLPVTAEVNGEAMVIDSPQDYKTVEGIFAQSDEDEDYISLEFPVTVMYPDYEQVVLLNQQDFDILSGVCDGNPDVVDNECVSINFPITLFVYNSRNYSEDAQVVDSNKELYELLRSLEPQEYYALDFPLSLTVGGDNIATADSNAALLNAINNAIETCETGGCDNPAILVNDIILYVPFSQGVVQDLKGNGITAPDDLGFTEDRNGNPNCAVVFNGSQWLHIPANGNNAIVQGEAFSVSLWFKMQNTNGADLERLFTKGNEAEGFQLSVYDLNTPMFSAAGISLWDNDWNADPMLPVDMENWHHLVITVDVENTVKMYRDGELRNSEATSAADISSNALDYYIGTSFKGLMDDLRVYKRVLSAEEVNVLFDLDGDCNACLE